MIEFFKNIFAPKRCYSCKKYGRYLCEDCQKELLIQEPYCYICKAPSRHFETHFYCKKEYIYFDAVFVCTHYKKFPIQKLLKDAKFYQKKDVLEDLSDILVQYIQNHVFESKNEILLLPTPMYFWKKIKRTYNQSEILVQHIWEKYWYQYDQNILKKIKSTQAQSHLSKWKRIDNLKNSFKINTKRQDQLKNKTCILVDDVASTGTTLNELSKILKENGVKKVYGLVFASD